MKVAMVVFGLIGLALATTLIVWQGAGSVVQATLAIGWGLSLNSGLPTLPEADSSEAPDAVDLRHGSTRRVA